MKKTIHDSLMSFDEYALVKHAIPYLYFIESHSRFLYYFGATHTRDSNHPQFTTLLEKWNFFTQKTTKSAKRIVLVEGKIPSEKITTLEESIANHGETGAVVFLANQINIQVSRPEPSIEDEVVMLLNDYSKEEIFYFYVGRATGSLLRVSSENISTIIERKIKQYQKELHWENFDFSPEHFIKIHQQIIGNGVGLDNKDLFITITDPRSSKTKINVITQKVSTYRNNFIIDQIEQYWQRGYSMFIVYGAGHAVVQERAIKSLKRRARKC